MGQLHVGRLLCIVLASRLRLTCTSDPLGQTLWLQCPRAPFPFLLANKTLIWFRCQCAQIQLTEQSWSKLVMSPCSLLSVAGLQQGLGPAAVGYDGKWAWEVSSSEGRNEQVSFCSHSLTPCLDIV